MRRGGGDGGKRLAAGFGLAGLTLLVIAFVAYRTTDGLIESDDVQAAAAVSLALFVITIVVLSLLSLVRRRFLIPEEGR